MKTYMNTNTEWQQCKVDEFWGEVAPGEHVLQLYDNDAGLLKTLAGYAMDGFFAGDSVIIIATATHILQLDHLFTQQGIDAKVLKAAGQYITLDAADTLAKFMVGGMPDERHFVDTVYGVVQLARKNGRNVRAFGEMVVLLWDSGLKNATIKLEKLWNKFCKTESLSLFCAYPKKSFNGDAGPAMAHICAEHSRLISAGEDIPSQILYKQVV